MIFVTGIPEELENTGDYNGYKKQMLGKSFEDVLLLRRIKLKLQRLEWYNPELAAGKQNIDRGRLRLYGGV